MRRRLILGAMTSGLLSLLAAGPLRADEVDAAREPAWRGHLRAMDRALGGRDVGSAQRALHDAYLEALGTWAWDGMAEVADAHLRLGQISGLGPAAMATARNLYLAALFRAQQQWSVDGVLRAAEGFARVGDRAAAEQSLRTAERLATEVGDPLAPARIRAFAAKLPDMLGVTPEAGR